MTNIPKLQPRCSVNYTVNVTYDHVVGLFNVSTPYTVNISNVEVLYIVGLGQPRLYFNGSGLQLVNNDNTTSVILENLVFDDCNLCMAISGIYDGEYTFYLRSFAITDVVLYNSGSMGVAAKVVHCHGLYCYNSSLFGCLTILNPGIGDSEIVVTNSTFEYVYNYHSSSIWITVDGSPSNYNSVLIKNCQFFSIIAAAILFKMANDNHNHYFINFTVQECWMNSSETSFVVMEFGAASLASGSVSIVNNLISNNSCYSCISMKCTDDTSSSQGQVAVYKKNLAIRILNNNFAGNAGTTIDLNNLAYIEIASSYFINNTADDYIISVKFPNVISYTKVNICMP